MTTPHQCKPHPAFHNRLLPVLSPSEVRCAYSHGGEARAQLKQKLGIGVTVLADAVAENVGITDAVSGELAEMVCQSIADQIDNPGSGEGRLWRALDNHANDHAAVWAYLRRCLINAAQRIVGRESRLMAGATPVSSDEPAEEHDYDLTTVSQWLAVLGLRERTVLLLRVVEQLDYANIALIMGVSTENARKIHQRALEHIRQFFMQD